MEATKKALFLKIEDNKTGYSRDHVTGLSYAVHDSDTALRSMRVEVVLFLAYSRDSHVRIGIRRGTWPQLRIALPRVEITAATLGASLRLAMWAAASPSRSMIPEPVRNLDGADEVVLRALDVAAFERSAVLIPVGKQLGGKAASDIRAELNTLARSIEAARANRDRAQQALERDERKRQRLERDLLRLEETDAA